MRHKNCRGQSLIEYIVLLGLMLVASLGVVLALKKAIMSRASTVSQSIAGESKEFDFNEPLKEYDQKTWFDPEKQ